MKYIVDRTSESNKNSPCKGAKKELFPTWETRTCNEDYYNERYSKTEGLWRSKGKNHKVIKGGYISRQVEDVKLWCIELNTLEDLMTLIENEGRVIIEESYYTHESPKIEFYDDYRE